MDSEIERQQARHRGSATWQVGLVVALLCLFSRSALAGTSDTACDTASDCYMRGKALVREGDLERNPRLGAEFLREACHGGIVDACLLLGNAFRLGDGIRLDESKALQLWVNACDHGSATGCYAASALKVWPHEKAPLVQKACARGMQEACVTLATYHSSGLGIPRDDDRAVSLLSHACDLDEGDGCGLLGVLYEEGLGVDKDLDEGVKYAMLGCEMASGMSCRIAADMATRHPERELDALDLFSMGCTYRFGRSCREAAQFLHDAPEWNEETAAKATEFRRKGCDLQDGLSCAQLGAAYENGGELAVSHVEAARHYYLACYLGEPSGCTALAALHEQGLGVPKDHRRAEELYAQACDGGHAKGCTLLGITIHNRAPREGTDVTGALKVGCDLGDPDGCARLAGMYDGEGGYLHSRQERLRLLERACDGEHAQACVTLGTTYAINFEGPSQRDLAWPAYYKACQLSHGPACTIAANYAHRGIGTTVDHKLAFELANLACDSNDLAGCSTLGRLIGAGEGAPKDAVAAYKLQVKACDDGWSAACYEVGRAHAEGAGTRKDSAAAVAFYRRGCGQSTPEACEALGDSYAAGDGVVADPEQAAEWYQKACKYNRVLTLSDETCDPKSSH